MNEQKNTIQEQMVRVPKSTRIISAFVDYSPMILLGIIGYIVAMVMFRNMITMEVYSSSTGMSHEEAFTHFKTLFDAICVFILPSIILGCVGYIYFLSKDFFGGQSLGKRLQKLQLVSLDGGQVSYLRMVIRNLFLVVWPIELIIYLLNSGQRLGDILCKTTVVQATEENKQPIDTRKLLISIALVAVFCSFISYMYYQMLIAFFDWYLMFLENVILKTM